MAASRARGQQDHRRLCLSRDIKALRSLAKDLIETIKQIPPGSKPGELTPRVRRKENPRTHGEFPQQ